MVIADIKVMLYIQGNEHTRKIKIVNVSLNADEADDEIAEKLDKDIEFLDREYPEIDIEFIRIKGEFGPELIRNLSKQWNIPVNFTQKAGSGLEKSLTVHCILVNKFFPTRSRVIRYRPRLHCCCRNHSFNQKRICSKGP